MSDQAVMVLAFVIAALIDLILGNPLTRRR